MNRLSPYALGATLYMPGTRDDLEQILLHRKLPQVRSLVICLEDSVCAANVDIALTRLRRLLERMAVCREASSGRPLVFVRPRNVDMAARLSAWPGIGALDGFVIPKLRLGDLSAWASALSHPGLALMPTLETSEVFHPNAMAELGEAMKAVFGPRILALRIGGNDLLGVLGLRRDPAGTLYRGPMGYVVPMLVSVLGGLGFSLTAPVFELLQAPGLLKEELALDIAHGLVGKTAIHPSQIPLIHNALRVTEADLATARSILDAASPAVFQRNGAMCEPATHRAWALRLLERARWQGVHGAPDTPAPFNSCMEEQQGATHGTHP